MIGVMLKRTPALLLLLLLAGLPLLAQSDPTPAAKPDKTPQGESGDTEKKSDDDADSKQKEKPEPVNAATTNVSKTQRRGLASVIRVGSASRLGTIHSHALSTVPAPR